MSSHIREHIVVAGCKFNHDIIFATEQPIKFHNTLAVCLLRICCTFSGQISSINKSPVSIIPFDKQSDRRTFYEEVKRRNIVVKGFTEDLCCRKTDSRYVINCQCLTSVISSSFVFSFSILRHSLTQDQRHGLILACLGVTLQLIRIHLLAYGIFDLIAVCIVYRQV